MKQLFKGTLLLVFIAGFLGTRAQSDFPETTGSDQLTAQDPVQLKEPSGSVPTAISNNDPRYSVAFRKQQPHGNYQSWYHSGQPRETGKFIKGIPDGEWKGWFSNGQPRFVRTYSADKLARIKYEIRRHPKHIFTPLAQEAKNNPDRFSHATAATQSFSDLYGKKTERLYPISEDSDLVASNQFNLQVGDAAYRAPFNECLHHGLYINYYPSGALMDSGYYRNGLREGHWEEWLNNGTVKASGTYQHGRRIKSWSYYDSSGRLRSIASYNVKGELVDQKFYE